MADQQRAGAMRPEKSISDKEYDAEIKNQIKQLEKIPPKKWTERTGSNTDALLVCRSAYGINTTY